MATATGRPRLQRTRFLVATVFGIIAIAAVIFVASRYIRFVPGYAVLIALAGAALAYVGTLADLYQRRMPTAVAAVLISVAIYLGFHVMQYQYFRYQTIESLMQTHQIDRTRAAERMQQLIYEHTGAVGIAGYLAYVSRGGSVISTRGGSFQFALDQAETQAIWMLELLIVTVLPVVFTVFRKTRNKP